MANKKKITRWLLFIAIAWLLIISTRFMPDMLAVRLEDKYKSFTEADCINLKEPVNIIVLGGGHSDGKRLPVNDRLSGSALGRLVEGIRIYKMIPGSYLITSGYSGGLSVSQAEVVKEAAIMLGVDSSMIKILPTTRNTFDEATTYKKNFGSSGSVIVVTDAIHMPRAMMLFKKAGLTPIADPTNHLIKKSTAKSPFSWIPSAGNIEIIEYAIHEYAGIFWTKIGGR